MTTTPSVLEDVDAKLLGGLLQSDTAKTLSPDWSCIPYPDSFVFAYQFAPEPGCFLRTLRVPLDPIDPITLTFLHMEPRVYPAWFEEELQPMGADEKSIGQSDVTMGDLMAWWGRLKWEQPLIRLLGRIEAEHRAAVDARRRAVLDGDIIPPSLLDKKRGFHYHNDPESPPDTLKDFIVRSKGDGYDPGSADEVIRTGRPGRPRKKHRKRRQPAVTNFKPEDAVKVTIPNSFYDGYEEPWCRFCGARYTSVWHMGPKPWGTDKTLCNAHKVSWKKGKLELNMELPVYPCQPELNTEWRYITHMLKKQARRQPMEDR